MVELSSGIAYLVADQSRLPKELDGRQYSVFWKRIIRGKTNWVMRLTG